MFTNRDKYQEKKICPFDANHLIAENRYLSHISKCKAPNRYKFIQCKFNSSHYCLKNEIQEHEMNCIYNNTLTSLLPRDQIVKSQIAKEYQKKLQKKDQQPTNLTKNKQQTSNQEHQIQQRIEQCAPTTKISPIQYQTNNRLEIQEPIQQNVKQQSQQQILLNYELSECSSCQQYIKIHLKQTPKTKKIYKQLQKYTLAKKKEAQILKQLTEQEKILVQNLRNSHK